MDSQINPPSEHGRFEQILTQFLLKSLHVILDSRIPSIRPYSRRGELRKSDKWFNLVLGDRPAALDNLNFWQRNLMEPMIIDVILVQETIGSSADCNSSTSSVLGGFIETVIERWVVEYEYMRTMVPQSSDASHKKTYKKSIILLRSLFSMARLLPAYKAFRKLCSSSHACDFDINYKVSSFSAPFSRDEEDTMKHYSFIPVDAQQGRLSISVTYRESLSEFKLNTFASFPPEIITDYVGSPAAEPLRAFPSTSFPLRGLQPPSSAPFPGPHSWSSGLHRGIRSMQNQPFSGSPPPYNRPSMLYESPCLPSNIPGHKSQNYRLPAHNRTTSIEDHQLSPPFSPSPPTCLSSGRTMLSRLRSETVPVSIPHPMMGKGSKYLTPNFSDPSRHSLPPPSPRSTKHDSSSQESPCGIRSLRKLESGRVGELNSGITNHYSGHKVSRDSKDDSGRFSSLLSSSGSPRVGFSRSSSRLSFQDDDYDFSCPFIVDDVDTDFQASQNLDGRKAAEFNPQEFPVTRKSQDAAVGALVHMLRTAPPLRQESSCYSSHSLKTEFDEDAGAASGFFMPRKTSDALEELRAYKEMKDLLLSKSGTRNKEEI